MEQDRQGYPLSGATGVAVTHYNNAVFCFNIYRGDPVWEVDRAIQVAPDFPMAHILKAYLLALATEPALTVVANENLQKLADMRLSDREASHEQVLKLLLTGNWTRAAHALDRHNSEYPLDILALQAGHLIDFYRASARDLRDRPARVLPQWSTDDAGYSIILGMYAFGLEEAGDYARSEETGHRAVELQPLDCWAHHAVAHVLEMQGRAEEGVRWMKANEPNWSGPDNFFQGHNWWHYALYCLEIGDHAEALRIYDEHIGGRQSPVALDLVDASAMLWRLALAGVDLQNRWGPVADRWEPHVDGGSYPFNDWHAVMANLGAGRQQRVQQVLQSLRDASAGSRESAEWTRLYGLPLSKGFTAFWNQDYPAAIEHLCPVRRIANGFGGSHAQRDIIDLTLIEAVLRAGDYGFARALANERCALIPTGRINRDFLARSQAAHAVRSSHLAPRHNTSSPMQG